MTIVAPPKKRRLVRKLLAAGALVVAVMVVAPFLFPTAVVRYWLVRSDLRNLPLQFRSATLSPAGVLTLSNVTLTDTRESAGKPLISAKSVRMTFSWPGIFSGRFKMIAVENLDATIRPGVDTPVTLLRLLAAAPVGEAGNSAKVATVAESTSQTGPAASSTAPVSPASPGLWFDQLLVVGTLHLEHYDELQPAQLPASFPVHAAIGMSGSRLAPARDLAISLGDADQFPQQPVVTVHLRTSTRASDQATAITVDSLTFNNLSPAIGDELLGRLPPLPEVARRKYAGKLDRVSLSGSIVAGAEITLSLQAELRDLSLHAIGAGPAIDLEHFGFSSRIDGKWTATPLKDLVFSRARCTFDTLALRDWKLSRAVADLENSPTQITLVDLQAVLGDTPLSATATYDLGSHALSRGRIWIPSVDAGVALRRLPPELRGLIPGNVEGDVSLGLTLTQADAAHMEGRAEMLCRDQLVLSAPQNSKSPIRLMGDAAELVAGTQTAADNNRKGPTITSLANLVLSANVSWNGQLDSMPEVTRGRLTADAMALYPPHDSTAPLNITKIKSDFSLSRGEARLDDFYASLPNGGDLAAQSSFDLSSRQFTRSILTLENINAELLNPWMPTPVSFKGEFDAEAQVAISTEGVHVTASLTDIQESAAKFGEGTASITDSPSPSISISATADPNLRDIKIESVLLHGFGAVHLDAAMVAELRKSLLPDQGSVLDEVLGRMQTGGSFSFGNFEFTGRIDSAPAGIPALSGAFTLASLNVANEHDPDHPAEIEDLTLKATIAAPLTFENLAQRLAVSEARLTAKRLTLEETQVSDISASMNLADAKGTLSDMAFSYADGAFKGEGAFSIPSGLDKLQLHFSGLNQETLTRALYPEIFTAEGPISGTLNLASEGARHKLAGNIQIDTDAPGKLKISRSATSQTFAPAAKAAAEAAGMLPPDFDQIVIDQLTDYPYTSGHVQVSDDAGGLEIHLDYARAPLKPGEPGYGIQMTVGGMQVKGNVEFNLKPTLKLNTSIQRLLRHLLGFRDSLFQGAPAASSPRPTQESAATKSN